MELNNLEHKHPFPFFAIHESSCPESLGSDAHAAARTHPAENTLSMLSKAQLPAKQSRNAAPLFSFPIVKNDMTPRSAEHFKCAFAIQAFDSSSWRYSP